MTTKTIYMRPGDLVKIRVVYGEDSDLNARDWNMQVHRSQLLMKVFSSDRVAFATPDTRAVDWNYGSARAALAEGGDDAGA
ncbi:hypothetical protein C5748_18085 [Phyllobacterium phragmitis]|uniref:Uncharacterized protein n=1 Tax=Phyllobacterium phragmitis TaxID=2670329 RepID=A0A2S9ING5_9HYPH|nr:hypothetical protein [Phyllobacterium phragmitis]PRD42067.1 hypothetical protein C5748_18085 [Phyllobacterium phragmitis]